MDFSHPVTVITGASRGLGKDLALGLAQHGFPVAIVARNAEQLQTTYNLIRQQGGQAVQIVADIAEPAQVARLKTVVQQTLGTTTLLINSAGILGPVALIQESDPDHWINTLRTNTIGPYLTCRAFVGDMVAQGWGRVVNVTSAGSLHPPGPLNSAYTTSKVALNQMTRSLAAGLAGTGVTANVIHPGEVQTAMWAEIRDVSAGKPLAADYQDWAQLVLETGGDPPAKTLDLILELCGPLGNSINGQFLWIKDGLQTPIASW